MNRKLPSFAIILFWVMFDTYYLSGIALSSFWQIWCKVAINLTFFLITLFTYKEASTKFDKFTSLAATSFFAGLSIFYLIAFLLFNFFELAINDYVGYVFLLLQLICSMLSLYVVYGKRN